MASMNQHHQTNSDQETLRLPATKGQNPFGALKGLTVAASMLCATEPALGQLPQQGQVAGQTFVRDGVVMVVGKPVVVDNLRPEWIRANERVGTGGWMFGVYKTGTTTAASTESVLISYTELWRVSGRFDPSEYSFSFSTSKSSEDFHKGVAEVREALSLQSSSLSMTAFTEAMPFTEAANVTNYLVEVTPPPGKFILTPSSVVCLQADVWDVSSLATKWLVDRRAPSTNGVITLVGGTDNFILDDTGARALCSRLVFAPTRSIEAVGDAPNLKVDQQDGQIVVSFIEDDFYSILQCSKELGPNAKWENVSLPSKPAGDRNVYTAPITDPSLYYRLVRPSALN